MNSRTIFTVLSLTSALVVASPMAFAQYQGGYGQNQGGQNQDQNQGGYNQSQGGNQQNNGGYQHDQGYGDNDRHDNWHDRGRGYQQASNTRRFMADAIQGNMAEIAMGRLAQSHAQNRDVRDLGRMLFRDHNDNNKYAMHIAYRIGMTPPRRPNDKQLGAYDRLSSLYGHRFDREFTEWVVNDHRQDIRDFQEESARNDGPVSRYANDTLQTLQRHLDRAQQVAQETNGWQGARYGGQHY